MKFIFNTASKEMKDEPGEEINIRTLADLEKLYLKCNEHRSFMFSDLQIEFKSKYSKENKIIYHDYWTE